MALSETPMLRTLIFALAVASLGLSGLAAAEDFPHAVVGSDVRGDHGVIIGRVTAVERDRHGNIIAVEIPGAEPPDAVAPQVVAHNDDRRALRGLRVLVSERRALEHADERANERADAAGSANRARLR